jgi:hypothetical protein
MDHRKTNVESLQKLNHYLSSLGFEYQLTNNGSDRLCFTGNGRYGNSRQWVDNDFPKTLLKKITYADWVDLLLAIAQEEWEF